MCTCVSCSIRSCSEQGKLLFLFLGDREWFCFQWNLTLIASQSQFSFAGMYGHRRTSSYRPRQTACAAEKAGDDPDVADLAYEHRLPLSEYGTGQHHFEGQCQKSSACVKTSDGKRQRFYSSFL